MPRALGETCWLDDCNKPRFKPPSMRGRSRYCETHFREYGKRWRKQHQEARPVMTGVYTPAEALAAWEAGDPWRFRLDGVQVYGLRMLRDGWYGVVLTGADDVLVISPAARLERMSP